MEWGLQKGEDRTQYGATSNQIDQSVISDDKLNISKARGMLGKGKQRISNWVLMTRLTGYIKC